MPSNISRPRPKQIKKENYNYDTYKEITIEYFLPTAQPNQSVELQYLCLQGNLFGCGGETISVSCISNQRKLLHPIWRAARRQKWPSRKRKLSTVLLHTLALSRSKEDDLHKMNRLFGVL
ncbi:hypothetical protein IV203_007383 [Nitzschia inconspicua]|uniref:Uncharacterized protein n=1 Tax=Nitzschia inconspicua TaxID=303405 RepID=A0A9K3KF67_9STRA|nr:hypothetical protein IV203_007383 [Nitzschia inconspicua]